MLGEQNPRHREHLTFFSQALDVWVDGPDPRTTFESIFATTPTPGRIRLFGTADVNVNLFHACCESYGETRGRARTFSLTDTLLLYALLIHRIEGTEDPVRRLRQLRNVNEASQFEMRVQNMPTFINEVREFMRTGSLEALATFNQNQVIDEQAKRAFLAQHPELQATIEQLEDHAILRGTLASFDLEPEAIRTRAAAFEQAFAPEQWPTLTGALLAVGPYQRDDPKSDYHQFGSPTTESVWRTVLVDRGDPVALAPARATLSALLDSVAASPDGVEAHMQATMDEFLAARIAACDLDWRYYLVRYPIMREGNSGIYYGGEPHPRLRNDDAATNRCSEASTATRTFTRSGTRAARRRRSPTRGSTAIQRMRGGCALSAAEPRCGACRLGSHCRRPPERTTPPPSTRCAVSAPTSGC